MPIYQLKRQSSSNPRRAPESNLNLVDHYNRIGLAAVNAALACQPKKQEEERRPLYETREES